MNDSGGTERDREQRTSPVQMSRSDSPFCHNALDRPTDRRTYVRTDRSFMGKFDDYRPLRYESDAA